MSWLFIAFAAQFILATSSIFDKLLLKKKVFDPLVYTFWWGVLGAAAVIFVPFGFVVPAAQIIGLALVVGIIFLFGMLTLFYALDRGNASTVLPLSAALSPILSLGLSALLLKNNLTGVDIIGMGFLVLGAFLFYTAELKTIRGQVFILVLASAFFFSLSQVLSKLVYDAVPFTVGFAWIKLGSIAGVLLFLIHPALRKRIIASGKKTDKRHAGWYLGNRAYAAVGSVLVSFAVSLAHPALVDATQPIRYAVIFLAGALVLGEHTNWRQFFWKFAATLAVVIGLVWIGLTSYARSIPIDTDRSITWGVTFSDLYSRELGIDPRQTLHAILTDLKPKKIRLIAYWDDIEKEQGIYDFSSVDWQLEEVSHTDAHVILAIGMKVPRWPECHVPAWASGLAPDQREEFLRTYVTNIIDRYKDNPHIAVWQVENEPFLSFGQCIQRGTGFLEKEVLAVRGVDTRHPILTTDSGEFGSWIFAATFGDMFGTTMYRKVYPPSTGFLVGEVEYPIGPSFFRLKEKIARLVTRNYAKSYIVIELQAEPWGKYELYKIPYEEHIQLFPLDYFREVIQYARDTGFSEYYLWGAEWWYFAREKHQNPAYWDEAKNVIQNSR